ncbi:hypothetical protein [Oceanobacillus oncorhynchi]|uniref:hypothetical protein n=1 Tax=Oceanobacillus oncorhynchi TaxID=545501 RepID=UPI0034D5E090
MHKDHWIIAIRQLKKGNMHIYYNVLEDMFGENCKLTWQQVQNLEKEKQMEIFIKLKNEVIKDKSKYSINKLGNAIHRSRSGAGGAAITKFTCNFCSSIEAWENTATPGICYKCARKMAENIVLNEMSIEK